jgi:hypothetical protein
MVLAIGPAVRADYSTEITGTKDGELADSRDKIAELKQYAEKGRLSRKCGAGEPIAISSGSPMQRTTSANGVQVLDRRRGCRPNRVYAFDLVGATRYGCWRRKPTI